MPTSTILVEATMVCVPTGNSKILFTSVHNLQAVPGLMKISLSSQTSDLCLHWLVTQILKTLLGIVKFQTFQVETNQIT